MNEVNDKVAEVTKLLEIKDKDQANNIYLYKVGWLKLSTFVRNE